MARSEVSIREARPGDVEEIFSLILDLAEYERARDQVAGSAEMLSRALFGPDPPAQALIAEVGDRVVGFAVFYRTFSTWECLPGLWLEDLYVPPEDRGRGVGAALVCHLAAFAMDRGYGRVEWAALDWNEPALQFYARLGARRLDEWQLHRLDGEALTKLARRNAP